MHRAFNANSIVTASWSQTENIGELLDGQSGDMTSLLQERIALLTEQMEQMATLRNRLEQLHRQMQTGNTLTQADWFSVLEMMSMFDKYFTLKNWNNCHYIRRIR